MDITQVNKDCEFLAVHVDTTSFASSRQHRDFMKQIKSLAESTGKKVIVLDNGIKLEQLADDDLRAAGLIRADFGVDPVVIEGAHILKQGERIIPIEKHSDLSDYLAKQSTQEDSHDKATNS